MPLGRCNRPEVPSLKGRGISLNLVARDWSQTRPVSTLLDRFDPLGHLGEGGMGRVLIARDRRLARTVALKFLSPELAGRPELEQRFLTEAQVAAQLEHPNIVPVYGLEHDEYGQPAFVMRLIEGETLAATIERWARLPSRRALDQAGCSLRQRLSCLLPICDAIHYAHEHDVIHRDLKPSNILMGAHGEILVTDWGLAHVIANPDVEADVRRAVSELARTSGELHAFDVTRVSTAVSPQREEAPSAEDVVEVPLGSRHRAVASDRPTRHGQAMGTIEYSSPEQWRDAASVTPAADQFSLALVALELATLRSGRDRSQSTDALAQAVQDGDVRPFVDLWGKHLDGRLSAILRRALSFEPAERYPTVQAFAADLGHYIRGEALDVLPDDAVRRVVRRMSERPVLSTFLILGSLLIVSLFTLHSVWSAEHRARRATRETSNLTRLTSEITHRTHAIESRLLVTEGAINSFGVAAVEHVILDADTESHGKDATPAHYFDGSIPGWGDRLVTTRLPVASAIAPKHSPDAGETLGRMLELSPLAETLLGEDARAGRSALESDGVFVALDLGTYIELPSYEALAPDYDPRALDWYVAVKRSKRPIWQTMSLASEPSSRELGLVVPLLIRDEVVGVLGALFPYVQLVSYLGLPREPELLCGSLLDASGARIGTKFVSSSGAACTVPGSLLRAVAQKQDYGTIQEGDRLWLFDRLEITGWYYVAEFPRSILSEVP